MRTSGNVLLRVISLVTVGVALLIIGCLMNPMLVLAEQAGANVLFILDGSGSMWGRLDTVEKIVIAKERLSELVNDLPDNVNIGLMVYGHRSKGDCDDIELMTPVGPGNRERILAQMQTIIPKGKTPITQSIALAAQQLETIEDETSIVLVSDGEETCASDPCAYAKTQKEELAAKGIQFTMHVVGFDVNTAQRTQLECIANAGGGRYFSASNAMQLKAAFTEVKKEVAKKVETKPGSRLAEEPILVIDNGGHMGVMWGDLMFTQDGRYLVSASQDKTIRVWDVATGETVRTLRGQIGEGSEGELSATALSPDDRLLAVGGRLTGTEEEQHAIRLIDFRTGEVTALLKGHEDRITDLAFSPDETKLISGSLDRTARIWDVGTGETLHVLKGHTDRVGTVAFSSDGKRVVTGSGDHTLKLWNAESGALIATLEGHEDMIWSAAFTPDGNSILSSSGDYAIRLWDGRSGKFLKVLAKVDTVASLAISPDGTKVVAGSFNPPHRVFSIPSGKELTAFTKIDDFVITTAISPDGTTVAAGGGHDHVISLWDINTGREKQRMVGKGKEISGVGFAKDGRSIAWGRIGGNSNVFGRGSLEQAFQLKGENGTFDLTLGRGLTDDSGYLRGIESVGAYSLRTKGGSERHPNRHTTLQILKNGEVAHEITRRSADSTWIRHLTMTPDGKTVISDAEGVLTAYDTESGKKLHDFVGSKSDSVAVSPDSRWMVSGGWTQTVKLWEIATGKLLLNIFHGSDDEWVAWIPEGYYTCSVKGDRYIGWHVNQGVDKAALYYPASKFADQFYAPDVVAAYLETGGDLEAAIRLTNERQPGQQQIEKTPIADILTLMPPMVFFQEPDERDVTVTNGQIRIKAGAKAVNQEPITDIWVLVNGKRSRGLVIEGADQEQTAQKAIEGSRAIIEQTVFLTQTDNKISVIAANQHTQSEPETIVVRQEQAAEEASAEHARPNLYVLAIGVSEYQDAAYNLDVAHTDAEAIADLFRGQEGSLYQQVTVRLLTNQDATQDAILDGLDWLLRESTQHDLSLLFVAGHGLKDERGNYYFLPYDGNADTLRRTGVIWYNFQDVLTGLPSKVVFLADTCHSGSLTGTRRGVADLSDEVMSSKIMRKSCRVLNLTHVSDTNMEVIRCDIQDITRSRRLRYWESARSS